MALPLLLIRPDMYVKRKTINTKVSISGIGLHSGIYTKVELHPAHAGSGITFVRADLGLRIPALQASTTALDHATTRSGAGMAEWACDAAGSRAWDPRIHGARAN